MLKIDSLIKISTQQNTTLIFSVLNIFYKSLLPEGRRVARDQLGVANPICACIYLADSI